MSENQELSERELEILRLVATGASNKEVAKELVISVNTVKVHLRNIFHKLDVSSRTEATIWAVQQGIVGVPPANQMGEPVRPGLFQRYKMWIIIGIGVGLLIIGLIVARLLLTRQGNAAVAEMTPQPERWQELASLSAPRSHFAYTVYEDQLYTIGGQTGDQVSDLVERYDPQLDNWILLAPKPIPVSDIGAAEIGGKIYLPGGRLSSGSVTNEVEVYDPEKDLWMTTAPIPKALSAYAITEFEGKLYLFGGWDGSRYVDTVYEFDPSAEEWREREPMRVARGFSSAAVVGNRIYIIGGYDGENILNQNDIFIPGNDDEPWLEGKPLPSGRYGHRVTSLGNVLYLLGGRSDQGPSSSYQYLPQENEWQQFGNLVDQSWMNMGFVPLGSNLHIWGGELGDVFTGQHWSYQAIYTLVLPVIQQ